MTETGVKLRTRMTDKTVSSEEYAANFQAVVPIATSNIKRYMRFSLFAITAVFIGLYFNVKHAVADALGVPPKLMIDIGPLGVSKSQEVSAPMLLSISEKAPSVQQNAQAIAESPMVDSAEPTTQLTSATLPLGLTRAIFTSGVINREPIDEIQGTVSLVENRVKQVYFYTELQNMKGRHVSHRWEHAGEVYAQVPFGIRGNRWRIYSSKRLNSTMVGEWKVSVVDAQGKTIYQDHFTYGD